LKKYQVILTSEAERDIVDIYDYIAKKDTLQNAEYDLDNLESLILTLEEAPERGHYPPELSIQGIKEFKEVILKPYRAIYEIIGNKVIVHSCVDGRRDMKTLLERRLIR
jgi:toxin ParE1/3/4